MTASGASLAEPSPDALKNAEQSIPKSFSCVLCSQRKVKCDRRPGGCANCAKGRMPCIYKTPPPPRRRKKGVRDVDVTTRLRMYEEVLRQFGVDPEELMRQEIPKKAAEREVSGINGFLERQGPLKCLPTEVGVLVSGEGKSRYLENGIWTSLQSEFRDSKDILEESDDESTKSHDRMLPEEIAPNRASLLFACQKSSTALRSLHPDPVQIFKLWQLYLDNINPLVKVFHAPTVQQMISEASGDLDGVSRNAEALLFAIYCITVESMADGECIAILGQSKSTLLQRFRSGAQCALMNASLLRSSDLMVLQAFTLFINFHASVIWIWSGIALRIGQRIGLHRDGAKLGLPPFEAEIRRRVWWQIMMLEGYSQKLAGTGTLASILMGDVDMPSNVNDSDLFPGMKEAPREHEGATEMMFFLIRCHVGEFLRRSADTHTTFDGVWNRLTSSAVQMAIKDKAIRELEALLQCKFLQYCDPSIPWHLMCSQLGKAIIFMMRFLAHSAEHPKLGMAQPEKDALFQLALQVTAAQNLAYTMKEMRGFIWHVNLHFQWKAFIYLLSELRYRTDGSEVDQAWKEVEKPYEFHPSLDEELARRALPIAVSNLTLKAWEAYIAVRGIPQGGEPFFIQIIRRRHCRTEVPNKPLQPPGVIASQTAPMRNRGGLVNDDVMSNTVPSQAFEWNAADFSANLGFTSPSSETIPLDCPEQLNWATWDNLLDDFQTNAHEDVALEFSSFDIGLQ